MDSNHKNYLERAQNEVNLAEIIMGVSINKDFQTNFKITKIDTYYNSVISHSYYCIFYFAKAYLAKKGIKASAPEDHKKTYNGFKKLVGEGVIDKELLRIYEDIIIKAEALLGIFKTERKKRGKFTYQKLSQSNLEPANESLKNAKIFYRSIRILCE